MTDQPTPADEQQSGIDVDRQQLGSLYAKALLSVSEAAGTTDVIVEEIESLVDDVLNRQPEFEELLSSPRVAHEEKTALLERVFAGKMSPELLSFLKVVSGKGRLDCLRSIQQALRKQYNELRSRVEVLVRTATPLEGEMRAQTIAHLEKSLGKQVELTTQTDPSLIGGMVVRIGDTVYDGSVANSLAALRQSAIHKSRQEIQDKLDSLVLAE